VPGRIVTARPPFALEVELHFEVVVVRARGVLDADAAQQLDACLRSLWDAGLRRLELDLSGVRAGSAQGTAVVARWSPWVLLAGDGVAGA
jgi:anti-anti-sigma regulatory factor